MQLHLTDRLACPRCGPAFGLILRADRLVERRVLEGVLGCPNCRDSFEVHDGFADLRAPPRGALPQGRAGSAAPSEEPAAEDVERLVALLGIVRGPGTVAMTGSAATFAGALARLIEDIHVVAVDSDVRSWPDVPGVSRLTGAPGLPFFSRVLRGVVVDGTLGRAAVFEGGRVVAPMSRVVVVDAGEDAADVLVEAGLEVLAAEAGTVVAARS